MRLSWRMNAVSDAGNHTRSVHLSLSLKILYIIQWACNTVNNKLSMKQLNVSSLLILSDIFRISTVVWAQLLNCQTEIWIHGGRKRGFLKTLRCCFLCIYTLVPSNCCINTMGPIIHPAQCSVRRDAGVFCLFQPDTVIIFTSCATLFK